jgi:hypothetical protein
MKKLKVLIISIIMVMSFALAGLSHDVFARPMGATSPGLGEAAKYSVLGATRVTNTGTTTTTGWVGVSAGTEITNFPPGIAAGDNLVGLQSNTQSAIDAQAADLSAFGALDQTCTTTYPGTQDLVGMSLVPGVYCAPAFALSGTLTLSGYGVWIFKSAEALVTSGTANVSGGDPCNVWWRVVSSATLGTNTSMIGNILAATSITMATGASLNGRAFAYTGQVSLDSNNIYGPNCVSAPAEASATATLLPVVSRLPSSGGAPIRGEVFPWGLALVFGGLSVVASILIARSMRRNYRLKK